MKKLRRLTVLGLPRRSAARAAMPVYSLPPATIHAPVPTSAAPMISPQPRQQVADERRRQAHRAADYTE